MMQDNLPLRGIPAALNSEARHSEFSQAAQGWLRTLRAAPEPPDVSTMEREIHGRQSTEWLRESLARQAADGARQADYQEALITLAGQTGRCQVAEKPSAGKGAAQPWAHDWLRTCKPLQRVLGGARALGLAELDVIDGNQLPFSPLDVVRAMREFRKDNVPEKSDETLSKALREGYPDFRWAKGNGGADRAELKTAIYDAYAEGKILDDDDYLDNRPQHLSVIR